MRRQPFDPPAETHGRVVSHVIDSDQENVRGLSLGREGKRAGKQQTGKLKKAAHYVPPFKVAIMLNSLSQTCT
jgi:hypothetical protein